mmetsp:Transcript_12926/g.29348  ORF Transcript_12926/g.29348 Transcript_12926/m.29348 type:complete len:481 (+) Transcript_12926:138-1580(+)
MKALQSIKKAAAGASTSASAAASTAKDAAGAAKDHFEVMAPSVVTGASAGVKTISAPLGVAASSAYSKATERFDQMRAQFKALLAAWLKHKVQKHTERLINKLPAKVKTYLEDPDMPRFVSSGKDRLIDMAWPDIREEIMWEVAVRLDRDKLTTNDDKPKPDCVRAFLRYHTQPYDKSIWGTVRDPIYTGFLLLSCLPVSAASPLAFLILFLVIDKTDEYQLINYILWFKGMQFFSHGILRTILGFFLYFACVTMPRHPDQHGCENLGPGLAGRFSVIFGGWVLQVILVWTAWGCLCCSSDKGRSALKGTIQHEHTGTSKEGGYMRGFLIYDAVCFVVLCIVLFAIFVIAQKNAFNDWPVAHALFACQVIYGYLSMPFFFFKLPFLQNVLTHAVETAYDQEGRCVRRIGRVKEKKDDRNNSELQEDLTSEEANSLLEKIKVLFAGGSVPLDAAGPSEEAVRAAPTSVAPTTIGGAPPSGV